MCAAEYDLEKNVMYTAQKRGPILLNTMLQGIGQSASGTIGKQSDTRCLLLIAHDTNITMVRTLMNFVRILPGYTRGSIRWVAAWYLSAGAIRKAANGSCTSISRCKALMTYGACKRPIRNIGYCGRRGASQIAGLLGGYYVR